MSSHRKRAEEERFRRDWARQGPVAELALLPDTGLLFGGGGFYYGPPYHYYGGGLGLVLLIVIIVLLFRRGCELRAQT